jgi:hypothetical protein
MDMLVGDGGNDRLYGEAGNDYLDGGDGDDIIIGGDGDDEMLGGDGVDQCSGGAGVDKCDGGPPTGDDGTDCNDPDTCSADTEKRIHCNKPCAEEETTSQDNEAERKARRERVQQAVDRVRTYGQSIQ